MEINPTGNFSFVDHPETRRDIFRIILLILALAVVVFAIWAYVGIFSPSTQTDSTIPVTTSTQLSTEAQITAQKSSIMKRIETANTQPLTSAEKSSIVNFVSRGGATYTTAEKDALIKVLRGE